MNSGDVAGEESLPHLYAFIRDAKYLHILPQCFHHFQHKPHASFLIRIVIETSDQIGIQCRMIEHKGSGSAENAP